MYIDVTIGLGGKRYGVSVDERQGGSAVCEVLTGTAPVLFKSVLLEKWVRGDLTFREQGIVSGDLLEA